MAGAGREKRTEAAVEGGTRLKHAGPYIVGKNKDTRGLSRSGGQAKASSKFSRADAIKSSCQILFTFFVNCSAVSRKYVVCFAGLIYPCSR